MNGLWSICLAKGPLFVPCIKQSFKMTWTWRRQERERERECVCECVCASIWEWEDKRARERAREWEREGVRERGREVEADFIALVTSYFFDVETRWGAEFIFCHKPPGCSPFTSQNTVIKAIFNFFWSLIWNTLVGDVMPPPLSVNGHRECTRLETTALTEFICWLILFQVV